MWDTIFENDTKTRDRGTTYVVFNGTFRYKRVVDHTDPRDVASFLDEARAQQISSESRTRTRKSEIEDSISDALNT